MESRTVFRRDVPLRCLHTVDLTLRLRVVTREDAPVEKVLEQQKYEITPSSNDGFVVEAAIAGIKVLGTSQVVVDLPRRRGRPPKTLIGQEVGKKRRGRPKGSKNRPKQTQSPEATSPAPEPQA